MPVESMNSLHHVRVVLSHTTHPGNIGAAARAMKTMGLSDLRLINPSHFPDAMSTAMACGADDLLDGAQVVTALAQALTGSTLVVGCTARRRDLSHEMLTVREAAPRILAEARHSPVALLFGTEMSGLSNEELDQCQLLMRIPANPGFSSLNLAAAVQVVAYELKSVVEESGLPFEEALPLARHEDVELFYHTLETTLIEVGFLNAAAPRRLMTRLRRLFSRTRIEHEEFSMLMGILKKIREPRQPRPHRHTHGTGISDNDIVE